MPRERCDWTSRFIDVFSGYGLTRRVRHGDRWCLIAVSLSERGCAWKIEGQGTQGRGCALPMRAVGRNARLGGARQAAVKAPPLLHGPSPDALFVTIHH